MSDLTSALAILKNDQISGDQTYFIDTALSGAQAEDIPESDVSNVVTYIDRQLVHNRDDLKPGVANALDRLSKELQHRHHRA